MFTDIIQNMTILISDELYMSFVLSSRAHSKILRVDSSKALEITGVHGFVDYRDIPGDREGYIDQPFAVDTVSICVNYMTQVRSEGDKSTRFT